MASDLEPTQIVYVVDEDDTARDSLGCLFKAAGRAFELVPSGDGLLTLLTGEEAGCILLDYSMSEENGLDTLKAIRQQGITMPVIMMTAFCEVHLAVAAMKAGAMDFIEKPWRREDLFRLIDQALKADLDKRAENAEYEQAAKTIGRFTPRERQVFDELIKGASNKHIARALDLSPRTIEFYRANVLEKAGVTSIAALVRLAFIAGAVSPQRKATPQRGSV